MVEGTDAALEISFVNRRKKETRKEERDVAVGKNHLQDGRTRLFSLLLFGLGLWKYLGNKTKEKEGSI